MVLIALAETFNITVSPVCAEFDQMVSDGNPPDLVLDFTKMGVNSDIIKSVSLTLGLPTVSGSLGEEGDLRFE